MVGHVLHEEARDALGDEVGHDDRRTTSLELWEPSPSLTDGHFFCVAAARLVERVDHAAKPRFGSRMTEFPVNSVEDVTLHLHKAALLVDVAAKRLEVGGRGDVLLFVLVLCRDPERRAADELVMLLVDDATRAIAVHDIDREVERLLAKMEDLVKLDEEIHERGAHVHFDIDLLLHSSFARHRSLLHAWLDGRAVKSLQTTTNLHTMHVLEDIVPVFVLVQRNVTQKTASGALLLGDGGRRERGQTLLLASSGARTSNLDLNLSLLPGHLTNLTNGEARLHKGFGAVGEELVVEADSLLGREGRELLANDQIITDSALLGRHRLAALVRVKDFCLTRRALNG